MALALRLALRLATQGSSIRVMSMLASLTRRGARATTANLVEMTIFTDARLALKEDCAIGQEDYTNSHWSTNLNAK